MRQIFLQLLSKKLSIETSDLTFIPSPLCTNQTQGILIIYIFFSLFFRIIKKHTIKIYYLQ
jgi:hypothetical protein